MNGSVLAVESGPVAQAAGQQERLRALVEAYHPFVWRCLCRLGVPHAEAEDWAQEVFVAVSRRLDDIEPGRERGFLYRVAFHHAAHARRTQQRRREVPLGAIDEQRSVRTPEDELQRAGELRVFYAAIEAMSLELRSVFLLYELEQFTAPEIADALKIPLGTVASRLRRARQTFAEQVQRLTAGPVDQGATGP